MASLLYQFLIGGALFFGSWALVEASARANGRERTPRRWRFAFILLFLGFLLLQGSLTWV